MSPIRRTAWLTEQITRPPPTQRTARALRITPNPRTAQTERTAQITRVTARAFRKPALRCPYRVQPKAPVQLRPAPKAPAPANKQKKGTLAVPFCTFFPPKVSGDGFSAVQGEKTRRKTFVLRRARFIKPPDPDCLAPAQALRTFSVNPADIVTLGSAAEYPPGSAYSAGRWRP